MTEFVCEMEDGRPRILFMDDGGTVVGHVVLTFSADDNGLAEIGYEIPAKLRGNGLATACVRTICVLAWQHTATEQIVAHALPDNVASQRVLEKNGFEKTDEIVKGFLRFALIRPPQYRGDYAGQGRYAQHQFTPG